MKKMYSKLICTGLLVATVTTLSACSGGSAQKTHDYSAEVETYQFLSRHWDESEIKARFEDLSSKLAKKEDVKDFIAPDVSSENSEKISKFLKEFEGKKVEYVYTKFPVMYRVKDANEYNDMRGILEFKFKVKDDKEVKEYTAMFNMARLGDAKGMKWKIYNLMWNDKGIDVTDVKISQLDKPKAGEEVCVMTTDAGVIKLRLFPDKAPKAVKNWIELSKKGFYNGTPFARVIKDFVIQGGALDGSGNESKSIYNGFYEDEINKDLFNFNGALCLGNNGPHTNGNQFYIVQNKKIDETQQPIISQPANVEAKYKEVGGLPELDGRYTVLGQVYEGMDVVEKIASQKTDKEDAPLSNPVKITKIEFEKVK